MVEKKMITGGAIATIATIAAIAMIWRTDGGESNAGRG
jgi:hypothetical protein